MRREHLPYQWWILHVIGKPGLHQPNVNLSPLRIQYSATATSNDSIGIYASSVSGTDTTNVKNKLSFVALEYNKYGELTDIKPLSTEMLPCIATQ